MNKNFKAALFLLAAFLIGFGTAGNPAVHAYLVKNNFFPAPIVQDPSATMDKSSARPEQFLDLSSFWETYNTIYQEYVDAHALEKSGLAGYGAAKGLVQSLKDPYSSFLDPKETAGFRDNLNGELEGIGAEIAIKKENLTVVTPLRASPAEKAGLLPNDIIYKINDEPTEGLSVHEAVVKIKGPRGTQVTLTILRADQPEPLTFTITRDKITIASVTWELKNDRAMVVTINQFSDDTASEFKKAIQEVLVKKPKGLIVDLRFNGGGYLESAVDILSELIAGKEKIVATRGRKESNNKVYYSDGAGRVTSLPLVVLVNGGSASASEIVAGAIQDLGRGLLIGEKTFGKGSVQEVFDLGDQSSLVLSVAKWYTPKDRNITDIGLTPDRVVPMSMEDYLADRDPQLEEALKHLAAISP